LKAGRTLDCRRDASWRTGARTETSLGVARVRQVGPGSDPAAADRPADRRVAVVGRRRGLSGRIAGWWARAQGQVAAGLGRRRRLRVVVGSAVAVGSGIGWSAGFRPWRVGGGRARVLRGEARGGGGERFGSGESLVGSGDRRTAWSSRGSPGPGARARPADARRRAAGRGRRHTLPGETEPGAGGRGRRPARSRRAR